MNKIERKSEREVRYQFDPVSGRGCKVPDAVFLAGIIIRVIRRGDRARGRCYFVLAAAFLAVVSVIVEGKSIVTGAVIRADRIFALVLTAPVVVRALVHVREEYRREAGLLHAASSFVIGHTAYGTSRRVYRYNNSSPATRCPAAFCFSHLLCDQFNIRDCINQPTQLLLLIYSPSL